MKISTCTVSLAFFLSHQLGYLLSVPKHEAEQHEHKFLKLDMVMVVGLLSDTICCSLLSLLPLQFTSSKMAHFKTRRTLGTVLH